MKDLRRKHIIIHFSTRTLDSLPATGRLNLTAKRSNIFLLYEHIYRIDLITPSKRF